jgi:hypothetical protein
MKVKAGYSISQTDQYYISARDQAKFYKIERGRVFSGYTTINPCYILCFHGPKVDLEYIRVRYQYVVRLNQPNTLVKDIAGYLKNNSKIPNTGWLECIQISYDKDQLKEKEPDPASEEGLTMSYGQKDQRFSLDC